MKVSIKVKRAENSPRSHDALCIHIIRYTEDICAQLHIVDGIYNRSASKYINNDLKLINSINKYSVNCDGNCRGSEPEESCTEEDAYY